MNNFEFYDVALDNISLFFIILLLSIFLHYFIFRPQIKSILDPYFLPVISSVFSFTVVFLLFFTSSISNYLLLSFILTQGTFFIGLYTFKAKRKELIIDKKDSNYNKHKGILAFYFFSIIYISSQFIIFSIKGVPLFMESRLQTFSNGGGSGILGRIADVTSIFSLYAFFLVIKVDKFRISEIPKYLILLIIFVTFFLSGSKSSFLTVFSVFWCYILFNQVKGGDYMSYLRLIKKNIKLIVISSLIVVFFIINIQSLNSNDNLLNPFLALSLRFVHSGDIFWYAYPNNIYLQIPNNQFFAALFNDTLGLLRLQSWDSLPEAIGITFKNIHHPSDVPEGPNARHNVFGLIYYGFWGAIVFSFFLGLTLSFIRNKLYHLVSGNYFGGAIFTYLMCRGAAIDTDPMLTITYFNNIIFILPLLYIVFIMLVEFLRLNPNKYE